VSLSSCSVQFSPFLSVLLPFWTGTQFSFADFSYAKLNRINGWHLCHRYQVNILRLILAFAALIHVALEKYNKPFKCSIIQCIVSMFPSLEFFDISLDIG